MNSRTAIALATSLVVVLTLVQAARTDDVPVLSHQLVADWPQLPEGWNFGPTTGVGVDSKNNVYVYHRGPNTVMCFDASGKFLRSWGDGILSSPHGLAVDPEDNVWVTDIGSHTVVQFSPRGRVRMVLGRKDTPGEDEDTFNRPTHIAFGPAGELYISDGYGNSRVVKYSKEGRYLLAWGKKGTGPGEFNAPHTIAVDHQGRVYVGDRENHRVQIFDENGRFLKQWTHLGSPWGLYFTPDHQLFMCDGYKNRVLKLDLEGRVLGAFGQPGKGPGQFSVPHHLALGKAGELYVAGVVSWRVQKFLLK